MDPQQSQRFMNPDIIRKYLEQAERRIKDLDKQ